MSKSSRIRSAVLAVAFALAGLAQQASAAVLYQRWTDAVPSDDANWVVGGLNGTTPFPRSGSAGVLTGGITSGTSGWYLNVRNYNLAIPNGGAGAVTDLSKLSFTLNLSASGYTGTKAQVAVRLIARDASNGNHGEMDAKFDVTSNTLCGGLFSDTSIWTNKVLGTGYFDPTQPKLVAYFDVGSIYGTSGWPSTIPSGSIMLDNIVYQTIIPEPTAVAVLAGGSLLGLCRRRRK